MLGTHGAQHYSAIKVSKVKIQISLECPAPMHRDIFSIHYELLSNVMVVGSAIPPICFLNRMQSNQLFFLESRIASAWYLAKQDKYLSNE